MLTIDQGVIKMRTRLFRKEERAASWARCLNANNSFTQAEVIRSDRAKGDAWFVQYLPANVERQDALRDRMQADRVAKALTECVRYNWTKISEGAYEVVTLTGNIYRVTSGCCISCNCEDFVFKCRPLGIWCKHILAHGMTQVDGDTDVFADDDDMDGLTDPFADGEN